MVWCRLHNESHPCCNVINAHEKVRWLDLYAGEFASFARRVVCVRDVKTSLACDSQLARARVGLSVVLSVDAVYSVSAR